MSNINRSEQFESKLEKNIGIQKKHTGRVRKKFWID